MDTQPAALFAADMDMTWLENGVTSVDWWNEHNGEGTVSTVNGATDYGDQGIFSNNTNYGGTTEPAVDTPFAPYYGIEMLSKLAAPGSTMVSSSSSQALLQGALRPRCGGNLNVLIDNEDPSNSYTVSLGYSGFTPSGTPTVYTLANNATTITSAVRLGDVGHRRAVLADGRAHPRVREHRRHRPRRARPAGRVRPFVEHLGQQHRDRDADLARVRRRHLPGRQLPGLTPAARWSPRRPGPASR